MKWYKYFAHPLVVGFIFSCIAIFSFAKLYPFYTFEVSDEYQLKHNGEEYFCDINNDGNSEKVCYHQYDKFYNPSIYLYHSNGSLQSVWNIFDSPAKNSRLFFGDYNQNGIKEIYLFTQNVDSLFLYVIDPQDNKAFRINRKFIMKLANKGVDYQLFPVGLFNYNSDADKEFYFALTTDHSSSPGKVFAYDLANDNLFKSESIPANIINHLVVNDLNGDGKGEILISTKTTKDNRNGTSPQLLVLNHQLDYFVRPVKMSTTPSRLFVDVIESADDKFIVALNSGIADDNIFNTLLLFDINGNRIAEKKLNIKTNLIALDNDLSEEYFTLFSGKKLLKINHELEISGKKRLPGKGSLHYLTAKDVNNDSVKEICFTGDSLLYIFSSEFKKLVKINISTHGELNLTVKQLKDDTDKIVYQANGNLYLISIFKSITPLFRYLIYLAIFIFITFVVYLIHKYLNRFYLAKSNNSGDQHKTGYIIKPEKSYNEINRVAEVEEDYHQPLADSVKENYKKSSGFKNVVEQITNKYGFTIETSFYPSGRWEEINEQITETVSQLLKYIFSSLAGTDKSLVIQLRIVQHKDYLNLLIEFPDADYLAFFKENDVEVLKILKSLQGKTSYDYSNDIGTIASMDIPLKAYSKTKSFSNKKIKIVIAEDHDVSLFGLVTLFKNKPDIEIVGTAKNGMEVLKILESKEADIVITDISMPGMDGIELAEQLKIDYPDIKVIVFTMYLENWFIEQLLKHGAKGFVAKNSKINELINAVYHVREGKNYYCPQFKSKYGFNSADKKEITPENQLDSLNSYEKKIMGFFAENLTQIKISERLNINIKTLETFIANIMLKLNAGDKSEIIQIAKKQKYISG
ncbi:MAG: response regulator transcription factor [Bacteroidales bacterium]